LDLALIERELTIEATLLDLVGLVAIPDTHDLRTNRRLIERVIGVAASAGTRRITVRIQRTASDGQAVVELEGLRPEVVAVGRRAVGTVARNLARQTEHRGAAAREGVIGF